VSALLERAATHGANPPLPFLDAPPVAALFRPLALASPRVVWAAVLTASLAAGAVIARFIVGEGDRRRWVLVAFGLLVFSPARHTLSLAQLDLAALGVALLVGAVQPVVALAKPQTVGPTVLALFLRRARPQPVRALAVATAGAVAVLAATAVVAPDASWFDWWDRARARVGEPTAATVVLFLAGVAVLVWGLVDLRRDRADVDGVCLGAAAGCLLAVMGGWNPQWFLALCLPLGALLVAIDRGEVALRRHEQVLLGAVVAASMGDAFVAYSYYGTFQWWVPIALVTAFLGALVLLDRLSWKWVPPLVVGNAAIMLVRLTAEQRIAVSMAVAVALVHLTLRVRPRPIGWRRDEAV
jgi:hypothetical protein